MVNIGYFDGFSTFSSKNVQNSGGNRRIRRCVRSIRDCYSTERSQSIQICASVRPSGVRVSLSTTNGMLCALA